MQALTTYRGVFTVPATESNPAGGCHCHFIPPHLQKKLKSAADDAIRSNAHLDDNEDLLFRGARAAALGTAAPVAANFDGVTIDVYDLDHTKELPGQKVAAPADSEDGSIRRAFEGAQKIYTYYHKVHGRNSIDDRGMSLISSVHYGTRYNNAFWNGRQMTYGDGDGITFDDFTKDFDVIAHKVTHGVVERTAGLIYQGQPGALNESLADVFGSCAKQFHGRTPANEANWLIGDKILVGPGALRSLKGPGSAYNTPLLGKDPQTKRMSEYDHTKDDNGGVHINSGIPNHAFYLVAAELGGNAWEKPARIWYESMLATDHRAQFVDFANTTIRTVQRLHGAGSAEETAVRRAWETVEVFIRSEPEPAPKPNNEGNGCCRVM